MLLVLLMEATTTQAQFFKNNALYSSIGVSAGNYFGASAAVHLIHKENYSFQANYQGLLRKARSTPDGYSNGMIGLLTFGLTTPMDDVESYQVLVGKVMYLNAEKNMRLNLKAGPTLSTFSTPTNWQPTEDWIVGPNYSYEKVHKRVVGVILSTEIEFPATKVFGVALAPYGLFTQEGIAAGVELRTLLGWLK